jgi:AraC-like DNA-binding protein
VKINRKSLFANEALQIGLFESRPSSDACGDIERQSLNAVVLPFSGLFAKHDSPNRRVIGTPSHAVFFAPDKPYRLSFPGAIGDRALTFRFDDALAPEELAMPRGGEPMASHGVLPAQAMMLRNALWARLQTRDFDAFEVETMGLDLLSMTFGSLRGHGRGGKQATRERRARAVERVKEAIALAPAERWTVAKLARVANLSAFHLCHVFRDTIGLSLYGYVLRERLAHSLHAVMDAGTDLSAIAHDLGFSSHSHFTARFRAFFGVTPAALRRMLRREPLLTFARS